MDAMELATEWKFPSINGKEEKENGNTVRIGGQLKGVVGEKGGGNR